MPEPHDHPPIPDRVAEGIRWLSQFTAGKWYHAGAFRLADTDGTPPAISVIRQALLATDVPANARPDDPRNTRRWLGGHLSHSPGLGTVPYPDEPAELQDELDALWRQATLQRRRDAATAARITAELPGEVAGFARALGVPAPRPGVVVTPQKVTWWPGARCVKCDTGQWTGTTSCWWCGADQPGVAWWQDPETGVVTSEPTQVRVVTYGHPACPKCSCTRRNEDGSCVDCTISANPACLQ
jgi:hypothetical protein